MILIFHINVNLFPNSTLILKVHQKWVDPFLETSYTLALLLVATL